MVKKSKVSTKPKPHPKPKVTKGDEVKLAELRKEFNAFVEKNNFLIRRSEFQYQQGLLYRAQAEELFRDRSAAKDLAEHLQKRWNDLEMKVSRIKAKK